jgi:hypothetical protein
MGLYINITICLLALIMIAYNFRFNKSAVYLGISLFFLNLNVIFVHALFGYHSVFWTAIFFNNFLPFSFLVGPFLYFFVRGILSGQDSIRLRDAWLFIPFVISSIGVFPYWISPFSHKLTIAVAIVQNPLTIPLLSVNWFYPVVWNLIARAALFLACFSMIFYTIWKCYPTAKTSLRIGQAKFIRNYRWAVSLTIFFIGLSIAHFIGLYNVFFASNPTEMLKTVTPMWLIRDVAILLICVSIIFFPALLYGRAATFSKKGRRFLIVDIEKFHLVFYEQYFFLNPAANIEALALALNFDKEDAISFIANQEELSFADFIQKSRINYLAELLTVKVNQALTADALAEMAGFRSRQTMYLAFKRFKNCSPTEFILSLSN